MSEQIPQRARGPEYRAGAGEAGPGAAQVIVVAPDKFKGSLTAHEVAEALTAGLHSVIPGAQVRCVPVADGGEGTVDAAVTAGFTRRTACVTGPVSGVIEAAWALSSSESGVGATGSEAVVELAQASGIELLPPGELSPAAATSRGTGDLLTAALDAGAERIVLGVGGSACNDGGAGLLAALGAELLDVDGHPVPNGGGHVSRVHHISLSGLDPRWRQVELVLASDVDNPLLGPDGAAAVFGPQKGLSEDEVPRYDAGLEHFADRLAQAAGRAWGAEAERHVRAMVDHPAAGAAGGTGFAVMAVLGARRRRGIDVVLDLVGLDRTLDDASLVLTGEGSLDNQSLQGKAPIGVSQAAAARGIPVEAVCGRSLLSERQLDEAGIRRVWSLSELEPVVEESMRRAAELLGQLGQQIGARLARPAT